jgi:hypothetical protein
MATNPHAAMEELMDMSFSVWSLLYQRKVGDCFFPLCEAQYMSLSYLMVYSVLPFWHTIRGVTVIFCDRKLSEVDYCVLEVRLTLDDFHFDDG